MRDFDGDHQTLLRFVLDEAARRGATAADALVVSGRSTAVRVRLGQVDKVQQSRDKGVGLRVFHGARSATTSTSDLSREAVSKLIARTVDAARVTAEDPFAGLPDAGCYDEPPAAAALEVFDPRLSGLSADDAITMARAAEDAALSADARLTNSEGAETSWGHSELHYANSLGIYRARQRSSASLWTTPVAEQGDDKQRDSWWTSAHFLEDLDAPEAVGREAARRTLRRLGARKPATRQVPVIFEAPVASRLLGSLAGAINGSALYRDASYLCDKLGQPLAPSFVRIVDDPHIRRGPASRSFDAEGLTTRRHVIVDGGVLASYLLDTYTAKKLGLTTTRSARRGLTSAPSPGASNFWMDNGDKTLMELISELDEGLLVTSTFGFGVNTVTGDYSQGAAGLWIDKGELAYPVHELTLASPLPAMWSGIDALADDRDERRSVSAPSMRITNMTMAGA